MVLIDSIILEEILDKFFFLMIKLNFFGVYLKIWKIEFSVFNEFILNELKMNVIM